MDVRGVRPETRESLAGGIKSLRLGLGHAKDEARPAHVLPKRIANVCVY